jgi:hypothetical protein
MGLVVMPHTAIANVTGDAIKMTAVWNSGERKRYLRRDAYELRWNADIRTC